MLNTVLVPEKLFINSLGQICSLSGSWFWIRCSFFTIWIFNLYSWIVSAVLCSDGVLSVPATKAFPKSQTLGNFPCKLFFFCTFSCCQYRSNQSSHPLALLYLIFDPIPCMAHGDPAGGQSNMCLSPFPCSKMCICTFWRPWRFPQDCRGWDAWDTFGLLSHLDSMLIYFPGGKCNNFHSVDSGENVHPSPWSRAPLSACPLWIHSSRAVQGVKVLAVCLQVHHSPTSVLGSCPVHCSACAAAHQLPVERNLSYPPKCARCDWEFHWSHPIKLYRELNLIALGTLGQYTWAKLQLNTK